MKEFIPTFDNYLNESIDRGGELDWNMTMDIEDIFWDVFAKENGIKNPRNANDPMFDEVNDLWAKDDISNVPSMIDRLFDRTDRTSAEDGDRVIKEIEEILKGSDILKKVASSPKMKAFLGSLRKDVDDLKKRTPEIPTGLTFKDMQFIPQQYRPGHPAHMNAHLSAEILPTGVFDEKFVKSLDKLGDRKAFIRSSGSKAIHIRMEIPCKNEQEGRKTLDDLIKKIEKEYPSIKISQM